MSTLEFGRVPFIAPTILAKYKVHEPGDTRFRAAARLHQALLRQGRGWAMGSYRTVNGKRRKAGNYLGESPGFAGNFISPEVAQLAKREVAFREDGALIDETRLGRNLLSSAPAVFNLFGPLKLDLKLASAVMRRILPKFVKDVSDIQFEHSPSRRDPSFTNDRTAFDVLIKCRARTTHNAFVAVEVKYSETMQEPAAKVRPRYDELSRESGLFRDPDHPALRGSPLQQLWRQHMLAYAMVANGLYDSGRFFVVAPAHNTQVRRAVDLYREHLVAEHSPVPFIATTIEDMAEAIDRSGAFETARLIHERYCDFSAVDALV